jgi:hypothetical protein
VTRRLTNNVVLNGFDRSGSTAISRTLAQHPDIELIMHPFNSGSIRKKLYQILDERNVSAEDVDFFAKLERGELEKSYIKSEWHPRHSTVADFVPGRLHVLKTTLNHFTISWIARAFPRIEMWGIWREPLDILSSILRNGFNEKWYRGAIEEIGPTVRNSPVLAPVFAHQLDRLDNEARKTAFLIAVRTYFFFHHLDRRKQIVHEHFRRDRNAALAPFVSYFGLRPYDFATVEDEDLNVVGLRFDGASHRSIIPAQDVSFCEELFAPAAREAGLS